MGIGVARPGWAVDLRLSRVGNLICITVVAAHMCCDFRGSLHHLRRELLSRFGGEVVGRFSESEKAELWDRFEAGESLRAISRALGRAPSSVRTHIVAAGWRRPVPAADWCPIRLSFAEREEISRGIAAGVSLRCIAHRLGRAPSTVSREVAANGGRLRYRAGAGET